MKSGARVALGVASGYLLGRTKKMKLALMIAGMAAGRQAGGPGALLRQGKDLLGQSPELTRLSGALRGRLMDAGKAAAMAVVTRQVESLTDRVGQRVESLAEPASRGKKESRDEPAVDEYDDDESADESADQESEEPTDSGRGREEEEAEPRSGRGRQSSGGARKGAGRAGAATATLKRTAPSGRRTQRDSGGEPAGRKPNGSGRKPGTSGRKPSASGQKSTATGRKRSQPTRTRPVAVDF